MTFVKKSGDTMTGPLTVLGDTTLADVTVTGRFTVVGTTLFNVKDEGAVGDGVADDTAAIQNTLDAANAAGGGVVYLPRGTYLLSAAITVYSDVTLRGDGADVSVLRQTAAAPGLYGEDVSRVTVRDLRVTGPGDGTTLGVNDGILLDQTGVVAQQQIVLENLFIDHFSRNGVFIADPITSTFRNVRSQNNAGRGFRITTGTSLTFDACYANGCALGGFQLQSTSYSQLSGCAVDSTVGGPAYEIAGCNNLNLTACGCEDINGTGYLVSASTGVSLVSCYSSGNTGIGFHVTDAAVAAVLVGVWERFPAVGATASVQVDPGSLATVIAPIVATAVSYAAGTTLQITSGRDVSGVDDLSATAVAATSLTTTSNIEIDGSGNAFMILDRNAATNFGAFQFQTNDATQATIGLYNTGSNDLRVNLDGATAGKQQALSFILNTEAVFNDDGGDVDFRVEGDADPNLIFGDAGNDRVGIGTNSPSAKLDVNSNTLRLRTARTPASATAAGSAGEVCWDANFMYVCVATNTWKRVGISTW